MLPTYTLFGKMTKSPHWTIFVEKQTELLLKNTETAKEQLPLWDKYSKASKYKLIVPRSLEENGMLRLIPSQDWCSGFFPGNLWLIYENTANNYWKIMAEKFTWKIEPEKLYRDWETPS